MTPRDLPKSWDLSAEMVMGSLVCSAGIRSLTAEALVSTLLLAVRGV
jgi:predicted oxidoreductase (fatty acid repression mutant protein)